MQLNDEPEGTVLDSEEADSKETDLEICVISRKRSCTSELTLLLEEVLFHNINTAGNSRA